MRIDSDELAQIRAEYADQHTDSVELYRLTRLGDNHGGTIENWTLVGTYPVSVARSASNYSFSREDVRDGAIKPIGDIKVTFNAETDVRIGDRVKWNNRYLEVQTVIERSTHFVQPVLCTEVL